MNETFFWHPFAQMGQVKDNQLVIARGEDVWVWDDQGNRYLDATASLWYSNVGHGRASIREAVSKQMAELEAYSTFGDFSSQPVLDLTRRLSELAPMPDARIFLTSGGGDSIDTAAKLARRYWHEKGHDERHHLIGRVHGYHGTHVGQRPGPKLTKHQPGECGQRCGRVPADARMVGRFETGEDGQVVRGTDRADGRPVQGSGDVFFRCSGFGGGVGGVHMGLF